MPPNYTGWSMYPALDEAVQEALTVEGLTWSFQDQDQDTCEKTWDTFIIARFACDNKECIKDGWTSGKVAMSIRGYTSDQHKQYNARVYHQRCKSCKWRADPIINEDIYVQRIVYWLMKWSGKVVEPPLVPHKDTSRPHIQKLCEGCTAGHCEVGKMTKLAYGISNL